MIRYLTLFSLLTVLLFALTGCGGDSSKSNPQLAGPEVIATEFFRALYIDKDLQKASKLATPEYRSLLESYGTARQVSRTLMNMSFDKVELTVNRTGGSLRQQYSDNAFISILLTGTLAGKQITELRVVELTKKGGDWQVMRVQVDKFSSSAR